MNIQNQFQGAEIGGANGAKKTDKPKDNPALKKWEAEFARFGLEVVEETTLPLDSIMTPAPRDSKIAALQSRAQVSEDAVKRYAASMENGRKFPPLVVGLCPDDKGSRPGPYYRLISGFTRCEAYQRIQPSYDIPVVVVRGTLDQMKDFSSEQNIRSHQHRTSEDKRRAIEMKLRVHVDWTDERIARRLDVDKKTVLEVRQEHHPRLWGMLSK